MRILRLSVISSLILVMLGTAGCEKSYYFNFTTERDLLRYDGNWAAMNDLYELSGKGLLMNDCVIITPHLFEGDIEAYVRFQLSVDQGSSGAEFSLSLYDLIMADSECGISISFQKIGTNDEGYLISNFSVNDSDMIIPFNTPIPGLVNENLNTLKMVRKLNRFYFYLNDVPIATNLEAPLYTSNFGCLAMFCKQDPIEEQVLIKDVKIIYGGERMLWQD